MVVAEPGIAVTGRLPRRNRWLAIIAIAGWMAVLVVGLVYAAQVQWLGDLGCEASLGDSNYGTHGWSAFPPGPTCTYTRRLNGFAQVDGPTPVMTIWLVALALGALVSIALLRRSRRA